MPKPVPAHGMDTLCGKRSRLVAVAAREKSDDVSLLIQTAVISIALALAVVSAGLYPERVGF